MSTPQGRYVPASQRAKQRDCSPAKYLKLFSQVVRPDQPVCVLVRESAANNNLGDQEARVVREVRRAGARIIAVKAWIGSGRLRDSMQERREIAKVAREHGAIVVAESASRYLRTEHFKKGDLDARPSDFEWQLLLEWMWGVTLCTIEPPDLPPSKERSAQIKRGFKEKWAKPGRSAKQSAGYKKRLRDQKQDVVLALRSRGKTWSEIVKRTDIKKSTARDWVRKAT